MSDDWDVDSYKSEFENEQHWQLRRNFMLAHKDKFPEDELVCLAQVFTNIEFMGCRYPEKTMIRVAELAKGVVEEFREKRKNSLKRTFVAASDAASAKVKGQTYQAEQPNSLKKDKIYETEQNSKEADRINLTQEESSKPETNTRIPKYGGVKTFNIKQNEQTESFQVNSTSDETEPVSKRDKKFEVNPNKPLGDFVLVLGSADEHPVSIIQRNSAINKCSIRWDFEEGFGMTFVCKLFLNNQCFATSTGSTMKMSKEHTAMVAIAKLRECYYGIRVKSKFFSSTSVSPGQLGSTSNTSSDEIGEDNIGRKLLKLMGWTGGGLGPKGQGREHPVLHVKRDGVGLNVNTSSLADFQRRAKDYVKCWMQSNSDQDLVFSSEFSLEERKILHEIALQYSLKSKSYGKESYRHLVISRKVEPYEILKELLKAEGNSDKYELLYPTNS